MRQKVEFNCRCYFQYSLDYLKLSDHPSTEAISFAESTTSGWLATAIAVLGTKTPPGSGASLPRGAQRLLDLQTQVGLKAPSTDKDLWYALRSFILFLWHRNKSMVAADASENCDLATEKDVHKCVLEMLLHGLSPSTINKYLARLARSVAARKDDRAFPAVTRVEQIILEARQAVDRTIRMGRTPIPTAYQLSAIHAELGRGLHAERNQLMFDVVLASSCRVGETPFIGQSVSQPHSTLASLTFLQKGGSIRTTSIPQELAAKMTQMQLSAAGASKQNSGKEESPQTNIPVFRTREGAQLSSDQMSRIVSAAARRVGCFGITIHRLRAANFTLAIGLISDFFGGIAPDSSAIVAGHGLFGTTRRHYLPLTNQRDAQRILAPDATDFRNKEAA